MSKFKLPDFFDSFPPGIAFIILYLSKPSILLAFVYLLPIFARNAFSLDISTWLVMAAAIAVVPLALVFSINWENFKDERDAYALGAVMVPQVPSKRLGGFDILNVLNSSRKEAYLGNFHLKWGKSLGHIFCVRVLFKSRIITEEPEYIKMILSTHFDDFHKGPIFYNQFKSLLGDGVFNADGEIWKFHRSMTRPFFTHDKISHFDIFDRQAEDLIDQIRVRLNEGIAVDMQDAFCRFTLDSASKFLFGTDVCSLSAGLSYPKTVSSSVHGTDHPCNVFANSFLAAQIAVASRTRFGTAWPLYEFWEEKVKKETKTLYNFIDPIVKNVLRKKRNVEKPEDTDITMLDHLVQFTDDPVILRDETVNILIAGRDTTASLLTFVVYMLAEHPRVLERLREEIFATVGPSGRPSPGDLKNMRYLRAVLNETLRLFPPVPFNSRTSNKPVVLPSLNGGKSFYIPANTRCHYSVFLMHRREDLWGPDALEFDPDRFLDDRLHKYLIPNPFIFLPFNAGPRICVGQQFAYNETSFMVIRLLQAFKSISIDLDANPDSRPPPSWANGTGRQPIEKVWMQSHLTMYAQNGLWVKMVEA